MVRPPRVNENARNQPAFRDGRHYPQFSNPFPALPERCKGNAGYSAYSQRAMWMFVITSVWELRTGLVYA